LYTIVTGVSMVGILVRAFIVFTWVTGLYLMLVPLYALAAVLSLILAVENVASRASGEILSLGWSQF